MTDPRTFVVGWLNPLGAEDDAGNPIECKIIDGNLTKTFGSNTKYEARFELGDLNLEEEFRKPLDLDILFNVREGTEEPIMTPSGPIGWTHYIPVETNIVEKRSSNSSLEVDPPKLMRKAVQEIRRIVRENMSGSLRRAGRETPEHVRLGSTVLYRKTVIVEWTQYALP